MKAPLLKKLGTALGISARQDWSAGQGDSSATGDWRETTDDVFLSVEDLLEDQSGKFASTLRVISLAAFHDAVGDDWDRLANNVMMIAESVIQRRIGSGNVFGQEGEEIFVLCFANTVPEPEARLRAIQITEEIGNKLIGAQFSGQAVILVHQVDVDKDEALSSGGGLDLSILADRIAARREEEGGMGAEGASASLGGAAGTKRQSISGGPAGKAQESFRHMSASAVKSDDDGGILGRSFMHSEAETLEETGALQSFLRPTSTQAPEGGPDGSEVERRVSVTYQPVWCARNQAINTCFAKPLGEIKIHDADSQASFDGALVVEVLTNLATAAANKVTLIAPVRFSSLASHRRGSILDALALVPEALRYSSLGIEITHVPADAGQEDMLMAVKAVRSACSGVFLRTDLAGPRLDIFGNCGAMAIGVVTHEDQGPDLRRLIGEAQAFPSGPLPIYALGLDRRVIMRGAVTAGAAFVGGKALIRDVVRPGSALALPKSKLLDKPT